MYAQMKGTVQSNKVCCVMDAPTRGMYQKGGLGRRLTKRGCCGFDDKRYHRLEKRDVKVVKSCRSKIAIGKDTLQRHLSAASSSSSSSFGDSFIERTDTNADENPVGSSVDPHSFLGVKRGDTDDDIRAAVRRKLLKVKGNEKLENEINEVTLLMKFLKECCS